MPLGLVVVTVNYNTVDLVSLLIWSIHRFLGQQVRSIVVVDNGSTDGSLEVLKTCAEEGICELIPLGENTQHGAGLSTALSYLARGTTGTRPWVWVLDSDCVVARAEAGGDLLSTAAQAGAGLIGEPEWDRWNDRDSLCGYALLLDPAKVWRAEVGGFTDLGDPIGEFEASCRQRGEIVGHFPFAKDGYVIHLGRGTLAGIRSRSEDEHPLFDWAKDHHEPHFQGVPGAEARYSELKSEFDAAVAPFSGSSLVRACRGGSPER